MSQGLLDGVHVVDLGGRPGARAPAASSATSAPTVVRVVPPAGDPLTGNVAARVERGQGRCARSRPTTPRSTRCSPRPTSCSTPPARRRGASGVTARSRRARRTRCGCGSRRSGCRGRARRGGVRPRRDGGVREHVLHRRSRPRAGALHRADGVRAHRAGSRVRGADRAVDRPRRSASTCRCRRSCSSRTWRRPARFPQTGFRGSRRGANIGRTREIWPTRDGFVSFGLRGGKARVPSLELLSKLVGDEALLARDWTDFNQNTATDEELRAIEAADRRRTSPRTRCRSSTTSRARPT